jgi:hypothetical protein
LGRMPRQHGWDGIEGGRRLSSPRPTARAAIQPLSVERVAKQVPRSPVISNTAEIGSGTETARSLCQNPAMIHCVSEQPPSMKSEATGPPVRPNGPRPANPPMSSSMASTLMLIAVRTPAFSAHEMLKSQSAPDPTKLSWQSSPPGLLVAPANAGRQRRRGANKRQRGSKLSPV